MQEKIKHLEFIQDLINRFERNNFYLRGWCVTLVSALLAFFNTLPDKRFTFIACLPIIVFWLLDGHFTSSKRRYRALYDHVRKLPNSKIDFSMDSKPFNKEKNTWIYACFSRVQTIFYGTLLLLVIIVQILISK